MQSRSRSILPESLHAKRLLFEISPVFISPDVADILSRMQNISLKTLQLVGEVVTCVVSFIVALDCVLFYLSLILCLVVIYV